MTGEGFAPKGFLRTRYVLVRILVCILTVLAVDLGRLGERVRRGFYPRSLPKADD